MSDVLAVTDLLLLDFVLNKILLILSLTLLYKPISIFLTLLAKKKPKRKIDICFNLDWQAKYHLLLSTFLRNNQYLYRIDQDVDRQPEIGRIS